MRSYRAWLMLLTFWFALLQTIAPLMHAHAAGETSADDGPHMHMMAIAALQNQAETAQQSFHWHVHADKTSGQIIGLGQAISESQPLQSLIETFDHDCLTACLCGLLLLTFSILSLGNPFEHPQINRKRLKPSISRHNPRAPPSA